MTKYLLLFWALLLSLHINGQEDLLQGYITTLDGKKILGYIGSINNIEHTSYLYFENDFRTDYNIPPQLIRGFSFWEDSVHFIFESHYYKRSWIYLQVIYQSDEIVVYQTPNIQINWLWSEGKITPRIAKSNALWIRTENKKITKIKKRNYKRKLKKLFKNSSPDLAKMIGQPGYQFQDILDIVKQYNQIQIRKKRSVRI